MNSSREAQRGRLRRSLQSPLYRNGLVSAFHAVACSAIAIISPHHGVSLWLAMASAFTAGANAACVALVLGEASRK
jgi:hypothetical protein